MRKLTTRFMLALENVQATFFVRYTADVRFNDKGNKLYFNINLLDMLN